MFAGPETISLACGIGAALSWGVADFAGGISTRYTGAMTVLVTAQTIGVILLTLLALILAEPVPLGMDMVRGSVAGILGAVGMVALYRGLAEGRMGLVAPLTAVFMAVVPVLVGLLTEGLPPVLTLVGFGLALPAVWLISAPGGEAVGLSRKELVLSLVAGFSFGGFLVLMGALEGDSLFWPLVAARVVSICLMGTILIVKARPLMPARAHFPLVGLAGIGDTAGNGFYVLAASFGRLDIAAMLGSLAPAGTVILAFFLLGERLGKRQWAGVVLALAALVCIAF